MRRLILLILLAIPLQFAISAQAGANGLRLYGNWCGPGTQWNNFPPIDPLDTACMQHDMCYAMHGMGACGCDVTFMRELRAIPFPNPEIEVRARAMYDALAMMPCSDPNGWAVKQSLMWSDIASDAVSGRASPFDVPMRWMYLLSRSNL